MSLTDLSEEISPFSVTGNNLLDNYQQTPSSSEIEFRSDLPLQKLRPVRNNQFVTEFTNGSANFDSISPDVKNEEWFCSPVNDLPRKDDGGGGVGVDAGGGDSENLRWPQSEALALLKIRSEMDSQFRVSSNPKGPLWEIVSRLQDTIQKTTQEPNVSRMEEEVGVKTTHSGSADTVLHEFGSDAGNENVDDEFGESLSRKRKREIRNELKDHFEDLVSKMMKKQEDMYKVLLETIEQKEKDRITREETRRNLERERMRKEEERRAQDTQRSLALLSFLGKFFGQPEINTPEPLRQQEINTPQSTGQQIINIPQSPELCREIVLHDQSHQKKQKVEGSEYMLDANFKRWPKHEVQALISLRTAMEHKFRTGAAKIPMWEEISLGMTSMGFTKTAKKCKEKWENINKYFKRAASSGKKRSENAKTCPYFYELDMLYKKRLINPEKASEAVKEEPQEKEPQENNSNGEMLTTLAQVCDLFSMSEPLLEPAVGESGSMDLS
ncbi:hypothetical protein C5167_039004 [Papaver somniferum]|uniref:Myb-like domain-containing protein n=1 Tax=Papaver somniferum TaxID=3469 RepID=A0A4Y7IEC8_PAPSO|nr:trihelix transcription factor GTL1-like [Papaver somniferum]RZC46052.1 hypothetical protein C5167_039004 [Papaver somniferum]